MKKNLIFACMIMLVSCFSCQKDIESIKPSSIQPTLMIKSIEDYKPEPNKFMPLIEKVKQYSGETNNGNIKTQENDSILIQDAFWQLETAINYYYGITGAPKDTIIEDSLILNLPFSIEGSEGYVMIPDVASLYSEMKEEILTYFPQHILLYGDLTANEVEGNILKMVFNFTMSNPPSDLISGNGNKDLIFLDQTYNCSTCRVPVAIDPYTAIVTPFNSNESYPAIFAQSGTPGTLTFTGSAREKIQNKLNGSANAIPATPGFKIVLSNYSNNNFFTYNGSYNLYINPGSLFGVQSNPCEILNSVSLNIYLQKAIQMMQFASPAAPRKIICAKYSWVGPTDDGIPDPYPAWSWIFICPTAEVTYVPINQGTN
ncbi:MAG TPA: hypothetical protein PKY63_06280 [Bacteroidales bacterium]|nr:hypothetical protein [Bacteroidales bacterium]